LFIASPAELTL